MLVPSRAAACLGRHRSSYIITGWQMNPLNVSVPFFSLTPLVFLDVTPSVCPFLVCLPFPCPHSETASHSLTPPFLTPPANLLRDLCAVPHWVIWGGWVRGMDCIGKAAEDEPGVRPGQRPFLGFCFSWTCSLCPGFAW